MLWYNEIHHLPFFSLVTDDSEGSTQPRGLETPGFKMQEADEGNDGP